MENDKTAGTFDCCPPFNPEPWDGKMLEWSDKRFVKGKVCTMFYMPLNFGKAITKLLEQTEKVSATTPDWLCLSDHTSKWNMDIYLAVDKEVPGAENVQLSGRFFCKVYEGPYKETKNWMKDYDASIAAQELKVKKLYNSTFSAGDSIRTLLTSTAYPFCLCSFTNATTVL